MIDRVRLPLILSGHEAGDSGLPAGGLLVPPNYQVGMIPLGVPAVVSDREIQLSIVVEVCRRDRHMKLARLLDLRGLENPGLLLHQQHHRCNVGAFELITNRAGQERSGYDIQVSVAIEISRLCVQDARHVAQVMMDKWQLASILQPLNRVMRLWPCLLYTSDAADDLYTV